MLQTRPAVPIENSAEARPSSSSAPTGASTPDSQADRIRRYGATLQPLEVVHGQRPVGHLERGEQRAVGAEAAVRGDVGQGRAVETGHRPVDRGLDPVEQRRPGMTPGQHRHLGPAATEPRRGQEQHLVGGRWPDLASPQPLTGGRHHVERPVGQRREQRPRRCVQPAGGHQRDRAVGKQVRGRSEQRLLQPGAEVARVVRPTMGRPPQRRPAVVGQQQGLVRGAGHPATYPAVVDDEHVQRPVDVDQLDQGPGPDLGHQAFDVQPGVGIGCSARPAVVLGPHRALQPGPLGLELLGRLALGTCLSQPPAVVAQRRQLGRHLAVGRHRRLGQRGRPPPLAPPQQRSSRPRRPDEGRASPARGRARWPGRAARSCPGCCGARRERPAPGRRRAAPRHGRRPPRGPAQRPARHWRAPARSADRGTRPPLARAPPARARRPADRPGSVRPAPRPLAPRPAAAPPRRSVAASPRRSPSC